MLNVSRSDAERDPLYLVVNRTLTSVSRGSDQVADKLRPVEVFSSKLRWFNVSVSIPAEVVNVFNPMLSFKPSFILLLKPALIVSPLPCFLNLRLINIEAFRPLLPVFEENRVSL